MPYETILLDVKDGVAVITLNRPDVRNAINLAMVEEIHDALTELSTREDVLALVLTGAGGKAFAAGADIAELLARTHQDALRSINTALFKRVEDFPRPTIAAIRGFALGGGCELALACDMRIAGEGARFGQPEVSLGIMPAAGGTYRLPRLVGLGRAKELIFTGAIIDAREAERIGLVNRVVPDDQVLDAALEVARKIASQAPLAVRLSKLIMNQAARGASLTEVESVAQAILFESDEKKRRMTDFLERKQKKS
ncbi:MAG TPA: enoyl-CoA hydratase-related protein [Planctomycetota bacterium]|nr:enoyl-CoA hydratase-related protein [Planctomycetota bacterium]